MSTTMAQNDKSRSPRRRKREMKRGRKEIDKEFDSDSSDEDDSSPSIDFREKDIWLDVEDHPGTKFFRKTIRLVVEEHPDEPYSKSVFAEVKSSINGREVYVGTPNSRSRRHVPRKPTREEFIEAIRQAFEEGRATRKARKTEKQKAKHITSTCSLSIRDLEQEKLKQSSESDYGLKSCKSEACLLSRTTERDERSSRSVPSFDNHDDARCSVPRNSNLITKRRRPGTKRSQSEPTLERLAKSSRKSGSSRAIEYGGTDSSSRIIVTRTNSMNTLERMESGAIDESQSSDIFFDSPNHSGTLEWRKAVRWAVRKFSSSSSSSSSSKRSLTEPLEFSSEIYHAIKQRLKGRQYYYSKQEDYNEPPRKVKRKDLITFFEECFDVEWYMIHFAEPDEVYFEAPLHRGTRMWKQAVQSAARDFPDSKYDSLIYRQIQKRLQGLNCEVFYVGNPPNSHGWATKREIVENCRSCYNDEKRNLLAAKHPQKRLEVQLGKTAPTHPTTSTTINTITNMASSKDLPQANVAPHRGKAATIAACARSKRRRRWKQRYQKWRIPGLSNLLTQWPWCQHARQPVVPSANMTASLPIRIKQSFQTDPQTGRDIFDRLNDLFQIPLPSALGFLRSSSSSSSSSAAQSTTTTRSSVPIWVALAIAMIFVTYFVTRTILQATILQLIPKPKLLIPQS